MNIGIAGYGKMGRAVHQISVDRGHSTVILNLREGFMIPEKVDCVIDFTQAEIAPDIIRECLVKGIPIVSGTTGWDQHMDAIKAFCAERDGAFLWAPNFSIGMHIVFKVNRMLAKLMNVRPEYDVDILETHHTAKKDKPSGTAIALANQIVEEIDRKTRWTLADDTGAGENDLLVTSERLEDVKGVHRVTYTGPYDIISLRHKALSRDAFALGAVVAAEWLIGRNGVFGFTDVMA